MKKAGPEEYHNFICPAAENPCNQIYPLSIAEGFQTGDIITSEDNGTVLFWHYCGFGYLSGPVSESFLEEIYQELFSGDTDRRFVLITGEEKVREFYQKKPDLMSVPRKEYIYDLTGTDLTGIRNQPSDEQLSDLFTFEPITRDNIHRIHGRIIPAFSWSSSEQFLENGFGFAAVRNGNVCAAAFSAAVSSNEVDIGVETAGEYRQQGLATALTSRMCREILARGKRPVWAHSAANTGSMKTARKCGFAEKQTNYLIRPGS